MESFIGRYELVGFARNWVPVSGLTVDSGAQIIPRYPHMNKKYITQLGSTAAARKAYVQ